MGIGSSVNAGSCAREVCPVDTPLITERRGARRGHREKRVCSGDDGLALRLAGDRGRCVYGEKGIGAGDGAGRICDRDRIIARVGGLHVAACVTGRSRTADVRSIETPLVIQRLRSRNRHAEGDVCARVDRLAERLGGNRGRDTRRERGDEIVVGLARTDADGIGETGADKAIIFQAGAHRVGPGGQTNQAVCAVAVAVGLPRRGDIEARVLQRRSIRQGDMTADAIGRRRTDGDDHRIAGGAAFHVGHRATNYIFAGGAPALGGAGTIRSEIAVAEIPVISQRIAIRICSVGGEIERRARAGARRAGQHRHGRRPIPGKRSKIDHHIERFRRGAALANGGDVNGGCEIGKGAADDKRRVVLGVARAGRRVEQQTLLVAVLRPAQPGTIHEPFVAGELLPELDPVIGGAVFDDAQAAQAGCVGDVVGVEAIGAAGGDRHHVGRAEPIEVTFVTGVKMVIACAGRAHRVKAVAILDTGPRADNTLTAGVPEVGVVEPVVVAQLVRGHAGRGAVAYPRAGRTDVGQAGPTEARHRPHAGHVQIVTRQHVAGRRRGAAGVSA